MKRLFKRNNKTTIAELEEYYANQDRRKTRTGMAWLMAILSLLITLAVIAVLFFGGRWIYRTFVDSDPKTAITENSGSNGVDLPTFDGNVVGQGNTKTDDSSDNSASKNSNSNPSTNTDGVVSDEAASTTVPNTSRVTATTGTNGTSIPNTGAGEFMLITPIVVGVIGYFASRKRILRNS